MKGDGERYGVTTGLTKIQFLCAMFENQTYARLPDNRLCEVFSAEFPGSDTNIKRYLSLYRNKYNRGEHPCQVEKPMIIIPKYDENGKPIDRKTGPKPRMPWDTPERRKS